MMGKMTAQRRSLCTLFGMATGFRAFYAVIVDGGRLFGSGWISIVLGLLLSLPVVVVLMAIRRVQPEIPAADALKWAAGKWGARLIAGALAAILIYDAGGVISIMTSTVRYVAMPEANRNVIKITVALVCTAAVLMGTSAIANAVVLWKRLAVILIAALVLAQVPQFRAAWLTPLLGPGVEILTENALPAAGMFSFAAAAWLMLEPEHDKKGAALMKSALISGVIAAGLALAFGMLVPGMLDEPSLRSFKLGRLLANDRAGLSLEMPYVTLIFSGMLSVLLFELAAAANALAIVLPGMNRQMGAALVCCGALAVSFTGCAEREKLVEISKWYYPLIAAPVVLTGLTAWIRRRKMRAEGGM